MSRLFATAALGTEDLVAGELARLGLAGVRRGQGGVHFDAPEGQELACGMRACLSLRAALRVLWPLASFGVRDADALYEGARAISWERFLTQRSTFAVAATTRAAPPLSHAGFLVQRVKDGIVDRLRERLGGRPDVSRDDPDVRVYVHVAPTQKRGHSGGSHGDSQATIGLDLAGESLHARGYRVAQVPAPLRETMAAAMLLAAGWDGTRPLADPLCGSATIAIEAALIACRIAPGRAVRGRVFGFERWPCLGDPERTAWRRIVEEADDQALPRSPVPIVASDRDSDAVTAGRANASACAAPVRASIDFRVADVRELAPMSPRGVVVSNPPYGERIGGAGKALEVFWRTMGAHFRGLPGHAIFLLCGSPQMARSLGMRPTWQRRMMNGPIPITLCRFEGKRSIR
ncbi:MAG: RNA methyltransferase [Deltaproteobacteria bacterium]|nr:RNA methyltransferase [Deltaproteobacteria bacterium]